MQKLTLCLQHILLVLKQILLAFCHVFAVISKAIGVLKNLSGSHHLFDWFVEEFQFHLGVVLNLVKVTNLSLHHWSKSISGLILTLPMIVKSLEVMDVSLEFVLGILLLLLHAVVFHKLVTFIVSTGSLSMLFPFLQANPTKFMWALSTLHVIAALILLDWTSTIAIGALFGICNYPSNIFTLTCVFDLPLNEHLAACRSVQLISTLETKCFSAETVHHILSVCIRDHLTCILAIIGWTPLNPLVIICKGFTVPFLISVQYGLVILKYF